MAPVAYAINGSKLENTLAYQIKLFNSTRDWAYKTSKYLTSIIIINKPRNITRYSRRSNGLDIMLPDMMNN